MAMDWARPLVSVVVPVYAGQVTLPELIRRCQAIRDGLADVPSGLLHELIFVCDEPVDDSESVLLKYAAQHDWIQVIALARNSGQHLATAVGILYASGDWIMTMDEDLQHPPELLPQILKQALKNHQDLVYVRSTLKIHASSAYRDLASLGSKMGMRFFTSDEYTIVSSFRMIRGELARSVASSVDSRAYLDAALFTMTSDKRRGLFLAHFSDQRGAASSGYNFKKLLRHYGRLIMSVEFSGLRMLSAIVLLIAMPLALMMVILLIVGWLGGVPQFAPGWLSLFFLGLSMNLGLLLYAIYSLKLLSVLFMRSSGAPPFLVISRELDDAHLAYLCGQSS